MRIFWCPVVVVGICLAVCVCVCETVSRLEGGCRFELGREIHAPGCDCEGRLWLITDGVVVGNIWDEG